MSNLHMAILLANECHKNQTDKAGEPYILHPLKVMMDMETLDEKIVAVLHDVVEDSDLTIKNLRENYKFEKKFLLH